MMPAPFVLIRGPHDGALTHACDALTFVGNWPKDCDAECGRRIGDLWTIVRTYRSRAITRKRVTCAKCKSALSSVNPITPRSET